MCPNWCYNSITVTHKDPVMLERFKKAADTGILQEFIPCPQELLDTPANFEVDEKNVKKYGYSNWYDWNVANWGTKWDFTCEDVEIVGDTISTFFDSAWSPPTRAYEKLKQFGFVIDALYHEPGMVFAGRWSDGDEEYVDYDFSNEKWREEMSDELADFLETEYESWQMWQEDEEKESI